MELVDRFLSATSSTTRRVLGDRRQYQLLAMTALYIAIKINERVAFGSDFFAAMSRGAYSVQEIEEMEVNVLKGLQWRMCAPTSLQVGHYVLSLVLPQVDGVEDETWGFILDEVRFQTEHAVRDYYFAMQRPSTVALAAIFNALGRVESEDRENILSALLFVMKDFDFAPANSLFDARNRLSFLVDGNDAEDADVTETTRKLESCSTRDESDDSSNARQSKKRQEFVLERSVANKSPRISPRSVACCQNKNVLRDDSLR